MPQALQDQRRLLDACDLNKLFIEHLGWDRHQAQVRVEVDGHAYELAAFAHKRGFTALTCSPGRGGRIPDFRTRALIDQQVTKSAREHIIIYLNADRSEQLWQWVRRAPDQRIARREYTYRRGQTSGMLLERVLPGITFTLDEESDLTLLEATIRAKDAFDVEKVTKRFYDRFKTEHEAFCKFLKGIPDESLQSRYVSVMLNRLMFIYFIQKKRFLDNDPDYLKNRLAVMRKQGKDRYYRHFLCPLFFEGFAKRPAERSPAARQLLGTVPYLNGGLFLKHQIEEQHGEKIQIPDAAFERLFGFFDAYRWHLDERPLRANNEINPDVLGYIFEKYINQKQMGAYYTKEDITEYIAKNTIIPFLFDTAHKECAIAFKPDGAVWRLLRDEPDRYIYEAVRRGVVDDAGKVIPESVLPDFVQKGMKDPKARMFDKRYNLGTAEISGPDGRNLALPTETWREYIARRQRCLELREKLRNGEVHDINDLVTLNLNIRQFAEDVIATNEGPELVRAFWKAIERVTVLDPTCGSGAFLFAALNILEPLYEACLNRMQVFLDDLARSGEKHHPEKLSDFRKVLARIADHPNHRYFVLKSIIVNNLFGVDIMEEATEICKLRLFLKLVAQIERAQDIEPLPDIDFNIRAGNTLVGFATLDDVRRAVTHDAKQRGQGLMQFDDTLTRIEEQARLVDTAFCTFREMQTERGVSPADLAAGKEMVRTRLGALDAELDRYLAGEYGISSATIPDKKKYDDGFQKWRKSHKPFHWFVDFYGIMSSGGFDAIIGNPPYVEYSNIKEEYGIRGYTTESCGNLYAYVVERSLDTLRNGGRTGMIVQLPLVCTDRMIPLQKECLGLSSSIWFATFDDRPSRLFDGLEHIRATIFACQKGNRHPRPIYSTPYNRWYSEARAHLFDTLSYCEVSAYLVNGAIPKIGCPVAATVRKRMANYTRILDEGTGNAPGAAVYFHNAPQYWVRAMDFVPYFWNERDGCRLSTQVKTILCRNTTDSQVLVAVLNSSVFYWWFVIHSDCRHLNMREIEQFPLGLHGMPAGVKADLVALTRDLMADLKRHKVLKQCQYRTTGAVAYDEFYPKHSKRIIDDIEQALAKHYCFTEEELDFIINYDIKYRMGGGDDDEED